MTPDELERYIRKRKGDLPSIDDLVTLAKLMLRDGMYPDEGNDLKKKHLKRVYGGDLGTKIDTCLKHLREIGIVYRWFDGPSHFIIHERRDEIVNGEDLDTLVEDETERVITDMLSNDPSEEGDASAIADGGEERTIRDVLSEEFDVDPKDVERKLRVGDTTDRMDKLGDAVDAIEDDPAVEKGDYGEIFFIHNPYRYELTERAVNLAEA